MYMIWMGIESLLVRGSRVFSETVLVALWLGCDMIVVVCEVLPATPAGQACRQWRTRLKYDG
jgi:hypothetical protein